MRLLDVRAVLDREKDIRGVDPETEVLKELDDKSTRYAILSHRWGNEVTYDEVIGLTAMKPRKRDDVRDRDGYRKIIKSCEQVRKDGHRWLWIDTCCIDKRSSSELSEAINSMYEWYRHSEMCYVYLHDVDEPAFPTEQDFSTFGKSSGWPEWFSRGWTLQELIAPEKVEFFNKDWVSIGTKKDLASMLEDITRIPNWVLSNGLVLRSTHSQGRPCIAHIMSWAADRKTTRVEDRAYSLLGLFGVNMPMLYGEGSKAFQRLQLEIIRISSDHSIFAWNRMGQLGKYGSVLADDPSCFRGCHDIENVDLNEFAEEVEEYIHEGELAVATDQGKLLPFGSSMDPAQLLRWDVTNLGIQVLLPVLLSRHNNAFYKTILPCSDRYGNLITIDLESRGHRSCHTYLPRHHFPVYTFPQFRSLYLDCPQQPGETGYKLWLKDGDASSHGFTRCGSFPREVVGDTVTFSNQGDTLIVLVYANHDARSRFAVGLGYYLGQAWRRIVCDEYSARQEVWSPWTDFAKRVYDVMWKAPFPQFPDTIEVVHLPRSVFHVEIIWDRSHAMIYVKHCPGCCGGRRGHKGMSSADEIYRPPTRDSHELNLDGQSAWLVECSGDEIELGDYGDRSNGVFTCRGNIFNYVQQLGIAHTVYSPVVSRVSGCGRVSYEVQTQQDTVTTFSPSQTMVLHQPRGLSLSDNEDLRLLLRALSTRLAGYSLVTTVIQCSGFYRVDCNGSWIGGEVGVQEEGNWSTVSGILIPLCSVAVPRPWDLHCARRQQFKRIREHFYTMANLRHITGTEACHEYADQRTSSMVDILVMFGLDSLQELVGEITFFERLPAIMQTWQRGKPSVGAMDGNGFSTYVSNRLSINSVTRYLHNCLGFLRKWPGPRYGFGTMHSALPARRDDSCYLLIKKRMRHRELEFMSESLSARMLERILITLHNALESDKSRQGDHVDHTDFDMARVHSTIQEVEALQMQLEVTEDDYEQRALEEDLTGQILWFYWCGICSEVDHMLALFVSHIRNHLGQYEYKICRLRKTAEIVKGALHVGPADDIAHLRRIMFDAGAGVSRHKLWLAVRTSGRNSIARGAYTPAASSTGGSPSTGSENDTAGIVEAGNQTDTTSS